MANKYPKLTEEEDQNPAIVFTMMQLQLAISVRCGHRTDLVIVASEAEEELKKKLAALRAAPMQRRKVAA